MDCFVNTSKLVFVGETHGEGIRDRWTYEMYCNGSSPGKKMLKSCFDGGLWELQMVGRGWVGNHCPFSPLCPGARGRSRLHLKHTKGGFFFHITHFICVLYHYQSYKLSLKENRWVWKRWDYQDHSALWCRCSLQPCQPQINDCWSCVLRYQMVYKSIFKWSSSLYSNPEVPSIPNHKLLWFNS